MKELFEVIPDDREWGTKYHINAFHKWGLPGVSCSGCGETWTSVGIAYPSADLSELPDERAFCDPSPVSVTRLEEMKRKVAPLLPKGAMLKPGTDFGPLVGKAHGQFGDFSWVDLWTLLIQREVWNRLQAEGVNMPNAAPTNLSFRGKVHPDLLELQIEPHVMASSSSLMPKKVVNCLVCGREEITKPRIVVIESSSIPETVDLFRGRDFSSTIFATERFLAIVKELKLSNILFRQVKVQNSE